MRKHPNPYRVTHPVHGAGTVTERDRYAGTVASEAGSIIDTGRVGVVFDTHTLSANPAFFYPSELEPQA